MKKNVASVITTMSLCLTSSRILALCVLDQITYDHLYYIYYIHIHIYTYTYTYIYIYIYIHTYILLDAI